MVGDSHSIFVETFQVQVQAWKVVKHDVSCYGLVSPVVQVIRCVCSGELERVKPYWGVIALVHHDGEIKRRSREDVKFKSECPTNVFISGRTSLFDLQASIRRRLRLDPGKIVSHIYYRVPQFPELRTTELYVETDVVGASSGGSTPHPQPVQAGPSDVPYHVQCPDDDDACELGDNRSFLRRASNCNCRNVPTPSPHMRHAKLEPMVEEALRCNDSDEEPALIEGDRCDEGGTIPVAREGPSSSKHSNTPLISRH
ncbi:hypothetical protein PIB30_098369 [Stylosanthes scabra]|uniref:Uncharacterized protein n=1 Tax=Stylosanthes scabra TaxID=79078 RepID=A0ABU6UZ93_9FABA|nr:hypothetical protein [Stylosanthes scabra]